MSITKGPTVRIAHQTSLHYVVWTAVLALLLAGSCPRPPTPGPSNGPGTQDGADTGGDDDAGGTATTDGLIADHRATAAFDSVPAASIVAAATDFHIFYGHTSHGSQIVTGLAMLQQEDEQYAFNAEAGSLQIQERGDVDLGHEGDLGWVEITRAVLDEPGRAVNLVMWSWCGGVSDNTVAGIDTYLAAMEELEQDYPDVVFVYMTGHLDGRGPDENLYARNNQIRDYCAAHDKVLYDFADIESYDPDGNYYPNGSDACEWCATWCAAHACPGCDECAHSECFNCYQKGRVFWWLLARLTGWDEA